MDEKKEKIKYTRIIEILAVLAGCVALAFCALWSTAVVEMSKLKRTAEEMYFLVEGTIIAISEDGGTIYCISDYTPKGCVDEVDVFDEVLCNCYGNAYPYRPCSLRVGDTVLYSADLNWQDLDLVVKIHEN